MSAGDRAMNRAIVAGSVGGFPGEIKRARHWRAECPLATFATNFHVAVGALREGIGIPVVKIGCGELRLHFGFFDMQQACLKIRLA